MVDKLLHESTMQIHTVCKQLFFLNLMKIKNSDFNAHHVLSIQSFTYLFKCLIDIDLYSYILTKVSPTQICSLYFVLTSEIDRYFRNSLPVFKDVTCVRSDIGYG